MRPNSWTRSLSGRGPSCISPAGPARPTGPTAPSRPPILLRTPPSPSPPLSAAPRPPPSPPPRQIHLPNPYPTLRLRRTAANSRSATRSSSTIYPAHFLLGPRTGRCTRVYTAGTWPRLAGPGSPSRPPARRTGPGGTRTAGRSRCKTGTGARGPPHGPCPTGP